MDFDEFEDGFSALTDLTSINKLSQSGMQVSDIPTSQIAKNKFQNRVIFDQDSIQQLADSISENGLLQPIIVRHNNDANKPFMLISGERRLKAVQLLNKETIKAIVYDFDDEKTLKMTLIENIQRKNLSPIEKAKGIQELLDFTKQSYRELSKTIGMSIGAISNYISLLKLPAIVQEHINSGDISYSDAQALATKSDQEIQEVVAKLQKENNDDNTKQDTKSTVKKLAKTKPVDEYAQTIQEDITKKFNKSNMHIRQRKANGKLTISFSAKDKEEYINIIKYQLKLLEDSDK